LPHDYSTYYDKLVDLGAGGLHRRILQVLAPPRYALSGGYMRMNGGSSFGKPTGHGHPPSLVVFSVVVVTDCICYPDARSSTMKKLIICLVFLAFFFSCERNNWDDTIITNNSTINVSFKFSNTGAILLLAGKQVTFPTEAHQFMELYVPEKMVDFTFSATNDGYTGEFHERPSWDVKVKNAIGEKATLSADGWMNDIVDIEDDNRTGKVYTETPHFIVTQTESNFPAVAVYNRDSDGNFLVVIQWGK
jgi:hypothetical protein